MSEVRFYMTVFTMIAVLMAGISPACAFMFGKNSFLLEICKPDGTVEAIEVSAEFDPFAEEVPMEDHLEALDHCAFCFAATHQFADAPFEISLGAVLPSSYLRVSNGVSVPFLADYQVRRPRGPPVLS